MSGFFFYCFVCFSKILLDCNFTPFFAVEARLSLVFTLSFSCSGWSAPCPSNQSCAARVWTTSSNAAMVKPAPRQPLSQLHHLSHLLLPLPNPPWRMSAPPPFLPLSVPTLHCHHTLRLSVLRCRSPSKPSQSLRPSQCSWSRPTVSRSMSSVGPPAASNAVTWSKVGWQCQLCILGSNSGILMNKVNKNHKFTILNFFWCSFLLFSPFPFFPRGEHLADA